MKIHVFQDRHLELASPLDCAFRNASDRMVILRCCGPDAFFLERVVFPFELLSFQCPPDSEVEIWTHGLGGPELLESFAALELCLDPPLPMPSAMSPALVRDFTPWLEAS